MTVTLGGITWRIKLRLDFCALCGEKDPAALEHHHFIPRVLGGSDDESNMFTVCGACHGRIHEVPRPLRLGELVKAGVAKAQERTAAEYRQIAEQSTRRAERATELAKGAEKATSVRPVRLASSNDWPKRPKEQPRPTLAIVAERNPSPASILRRAFDLVWNTSNAKR